MNSFRLNDILFNVEYKQVKVLRITVYPPDGKVCIAAPVNTSDNAISRFAELKISWIVKHRDRILKSAAAKSSLKNKENHYVWGIAHKLEISEKQGRAKVFADKGILLMQVPPGTVKSEKQQILDKWYRRILSEAAPPLVQKWEHITGIEIKKIFYRKMKSHWGSCNSKKQTIRLNTELAKKPQVCLEYVIVHEMLHVLETHHNQKYYRLMDKYFPDWKIIRRKMNKGEI